MEEGPSLGHLRELAPRRRWQSPGARWQRQDASPCPAPCARFLLSAAPFPALQDWNAGVAKLAFIPSPIPKPSAPRGGSGCARTPPEEAPRGAMLRVPEQGSPSWVPHSPLADVQPIHPPRPPRVWLAASHSGNCRHPEPSGCFPSAQAVAASAGMGLAPLEPLS